MIITTKILGATEHQGERVQAMSDGGSIAVVPFDYSAEDPYWTAASKLAGWPVKIHSRTPTRQGAIFRTEFLGSLAR